jgi:hypothetical protein
MVGLLVLSAAPYLLAQGVFSRQIGRVVFSGSTIDSDSSLKTRYAKLCNAYMDKWYQNKKQPLVYLVLSNRAQPSLYQLAFDNLDGNSLKTKLYGRKGKYDLPGIRIMIYSNNRQADILLKMLDYAVNNLSELKAVRNRALRKDYYDQPDNLS